MTDTHKWPELIKELLAVIEQKLPANDPNYNEVAKDVALGISEHLGGQTVYIPKSRELMVHLRGVQIYNEFRGNNIRELANRYSLSEPRIYQIIQDERERRNPKQQALF